MLEEEDRWDKLKSWANVQHDIQTRLQALDKFDQSVSLHHGPQLYHTLRHPSHIKCMTHFTSNVGENFVTHYRIGTMDHFSVWNMESRERDAACNQRRFNIDAEITTLMFVPKHRVYLGFGSDLVMRVYTDAMSGCKNVGSIPCDTTILCMSYNKDTDEVYAGGIGVLEKWKFTGSEHSAVAQRGEMFDTELRSDEWVIDIKVDPRNKQMLALTHDGIYVVSFVSMKQTHLLQNRHEGSLRCCSFYKQREYFITGGGDGQVKVWNAVVFTQVHVFYGHRGPITGLQVHSTDPLLFSSSMDGTVQIWRMDNFSKFMRVDLGDGIRQMKLLGDEEFFCQTEKEIRIYNLNQFYTLFAPVESTVFKLQLFPSVHGRASRVLCSTEDGSVRFFSPVTGATITIVYPMPTFQVLTSFAYNRDKEKLLTILQNGDVLVFNCTTNPSKAEEVWQAASVDEEVTQLAIMALSYKDLEEEVVREIVVFGGLKNGQVSLLDADRCVMVKNLQAHEGAITCMEATTDIDDRGKQILETNTTLVTGGEEKSLKVWSVCVKAGHSGNKITLEPLIKIPCAGIPDLLSVYENTLCVTINSPDTNLYLRMYRMDGRDLENVSSLQFTELHHAKDEEHTKRMTALDKCPLLGLFATAGEDGYIKVWNRHNQLVREMYFGEPLYGLCFANARGDLLVGFQNHVCLIPLTNFFPQNYLELISLQEFKDDLREPPIPYSSKVKSWFDPSKLPTFSTTLSIRNQEKKDPDIDQDVLEDIEDHSDSEDSLLDAPTYKKYRLPKSKLNVQEENLLKELERKRKSVVEPDVMQYTDFTDIFNDLYKAEESPQPTDIEEGFESDIEETPRTKKSKKEKRRKSMSSIPNIHLLSPFEQALLKRKPIIALDGYIPNSVIRKQLSYRPPTPPQPQKRKDVWRPKPVPKPMPKKEVEEEEVMDLYEKPLVWGEPEPSTKKSIMSPWKKMTSMVRTTSNLSSTSSKRAYKPPSRRSTPNTPTKYELPSIVKHQHQHQHFVKSKAFEFGNVFDVRGPHPKSGGPGSRERTKSFRLSNMVVDEDSTDVRFKEKESRKKAIQVNDMEVMHKLMKEDFFRDLKGTPSYESVLQQLLTMLDTDDADLHGKVCNYILEIHEDVGISDVYLDRIINKLSNQLTSGNIQTSIRKNGLSALSVIGKSRQDVVATILPRLIDSSTDIREEAAEALAALTGVTNKTELWNLMEEMGLQKTYNSKEDEEEALKALAMRLDVPYRPDSFTDWIGDWMDDMQSPAMYDVEDDLQLNDIEKAWGGRDKRWKPESLYLSESVSRASNRLKELSFISDRSRGWTPGTTTRTRMDFRNELENLKESVDGQGPQSPRRISRGRLDKENLISTQNDGSGRSYNSEMDDWFDPRDPHLYKYYRNQYKRPGSGRPIVGKRGGALDRFGKFGEDSDGEGHLRSQGEFVDSSITQPEDITTDSMSAQDSGIGGELSESVTSRSSKGQLVSSHPSFMSSERSQGHPSKGVGRKRSKLSDWSRTQLSPVKSSSSLHKSAMSTPRFSRDWQKFFNTPTAQERKRMDMVKKDFTEGKVKHPISATINYISDDLPMLPGEAGLRLLHRVKVGEKMDESKHEQRHQVEAIPGKLSSQTKNENRGQAQYGILSMQWITDIPVSNAPNVSTPRFQPRSDAGSSLSQVTERSQDVHTVKSMGRETSRLPRLAQKYSKINVSREKSRRDTDDESFYLPTIPGAYTPDFVWEHPLPPPPPRESRTNIASIKKQQEEYCKYYKMIKHNMQKYTSNVPSLPKVDIKQAIPTSKLQKSLTKMSKLSRGPSLFFPKITLNQLISST
ncbi:uncharacterized protein LOC133178950 isoform X2 [Saccostrea echinata]|uniref:uncharacterized protein LOC133178950 isoform X2 n=1 Tax=Saccostrea echinata TaxID=191078 RepID=UPI002A824910|nr:uncharacterized protein LOC133178950 isoform X2 [Saccostrea echinata]